MIFYVLLFLVLIISIIKHPNNKKMGVFWICFLCFLSMFRAESVGTDTAAYIDFINPKQEFIINFSENFDIGRALEFGYLYAKMWIYENNYSARILICIFSLITFLFLLLSLKRMGLPYGIGILIFTVLFYLSSFNIARQICACSIILYAYTFLFENGNKRYFFFLFILLATSFHGTSILYSVMYIVRYLKLDIINKRTLVSFAIVLFLVNMIYPLPISEWLVSSFGSISYAEIYSDRGVTSSRSIIGIIYSFLQVFPSLLIFIKCTDTKLRYYDLIFYMSIISIILSSTANSDFARIFIPLQIFQILYIANLFTIKRVYRYPIYLFIVLNSLLTLYGASIGAGEVVPYIIDFNFSV